MANEMNVFTPGERVLVRWHDRNLYPGRIVDTGALGATIEMPDGSRHPVPYAYLTPAAPAPSPAGPTTSDEPG